MQDKLRSLIFLFIAVIVIQGIIGITIFYSFNTMQDRGTFGDMFGAVNTLFSGLAFAGVIYAIFLQRKELELQRKELELSREELTRSADAQQKTSLALSQQLSIMIQNFNYELEKDAKKAQPILQNAGGSCSPGNVTWDFINVGAIVTEVKAIPKSDFKLSFPKILFSDVKGSFDLNYDPNNKSVNLKFDLVYTDALGERRKKEYEYIPNEGLIELLGSSSDK